MTTRWLALALLLFALVPVAARADGRWLLVSDVHLDPTDQSAAPSTPGHDTNPALFASAIAKMRAVDADPAVVVIAGDFLAHHFRGSALVTMSSIERAFATAFPRSRFLITLGNNDDPCGDYRVSYESAYLRALAKIWAPLIDRDNAAPQFAAQFGKDGAYVASLPNSGVRAVVVNSVYWSSHYGAACSPIADPGDTEMRWLQRTLAATPRDQRNVVLMHVPPGIDGYSTAFVHGAATIAFMNDAASARLVDLLSNPRNRVAYALAGHTHELMARNLDGVPMQILPAISPVYGRPPSFLLAEVAPDGAIIGFTGYAYDYQTTRWDAPVETPADRYAICARTALTRSAYAACAGIPNGKIWAAAIALGVLVLAGLGWVIFVLARRLAKMV